MGSVKSLAGAIKVEVELDRSMASQVDKDNVSPLKGQVSKFVKGIVGDLAIPVTINVELRPDRIIDRPFTVRINGKPCRMPFATQILDDATVRTLAIQITVVIQENREDLIDYSIADGIREAWSSTEGGIYLVGLSRSAFLNYLRMLVRRCFRIDRGDHMYPSTPDSLKRWTAEHCFEEAVRSLDALRVVLYRSPKAPIQSVNADEKSIEKMFRMMQDGLFYELGVRIPQVEIHEDAKLGRHECRIQINDLRLSPFRGLDESEFLVNDTVDRLTLLNVKGKEAVNPANGSECAIVRDTNGLAGVCEQAGLTTWDFNGYIVLATSAQLRRYAGSFIVLETAGCDLSRLDAVFPNLTRVVRDRFDFPTIVQVFRHLIDEQISIRDMRGVLEAMLATKATVEVDFYKYIVFAPYAMAPCPATQGIGIEDVDASGYAECVRTRFKHYISHKYTRGGSTLVVYLLDRSMESRLMESNERPLLEKERKKFLDAVLAEVGYLPPTAQNPVILTTWEVRKRFRKLIEVEFPRLAVLSYQELSPDMNIQPIAKISLDS